MNVAVLEGHKVVRNGPYRSVGHPAYQGGLVAFLRLWLAVSNWLSVLFAMLPYAAAILYRIHVGEEALKESLGGEYLEYMRGTKRLILGIY